MTPRCSTTRSRFVGQRVAAVVADSSAIAERACRAIAVDLRGAARGVRPRRRPLAGGAAAARRQDRRRPHRRPRPQRRRRGARRHRRRRGRRGCRRGGRRRVGDRAVHHPAGPARAPGDPRLHRLARRAGPAGVAHQHPGAVPGPRRDLPSVRPGPRRRARVRAPGRGRLRRQAGDAHRGHRRAGRAAARPARALRVQPHRPVHDGALPAPVPRRRHRVRPAPTAC